MLYYGKYSKHELYYKNYEHDKYFNNDDFK